MRIATVALLCLIAGVSSADTPFEKALSAKLMKELNDGLSCSVALQAAQDKIAELEKKLEEKR